MYTFQGKLILLHISVQTPSPLPPFLKGEGWDFWKMAVMGGWKIYTRNGGKPGMREELALKWGDGKFVVSLHSWQRSANLLFYEDPPYIAYPPCHPFFKFWPPLFPAPHPYFQLLPPRFILLSCFFGWMGDHATFDVLFYLMIIMDLHVEPWYLSTTRTLMWVLCNKASSLLRPDTMCFFTGTLIWYHTQTNTQTHNTLRGQ